MRIIISNNPLLKPLYKNIPANANSASISTNINSSNSNSNYSLSVFSDIKCIEELKKNDFSLALISPLIFSMIIGDADLRIIPAKMLVIEDFTNSVAIKIKNNTKKLETIYFNNLNEYIIVATKLVLAERFNIVPILVNSAASADIIVTYNDNLDTNIEEENTEEENIEEENLDTFSIDLTEDWYDTFEVPFVAGFWIVNAENEVANSAVELVNSFADSSLPEKEIFVYENDEYKRFGFKYWCWKEEFAKAFEKIFDTLYYHNYASHIADIKLLNNS